MEQDFEHQYDPALEKFEAMLESDETYFFEPEEYTSIIEHYLDNTHFNKAQKAIIIATEQYPLDIDIKLLHVELLIIKNKSEKALVLLDELQIMDPKNDEVYTQKAAIYSKRSEHKKAISFLKMALKCVSSPEDVCDINSQLGVEYMHSNDLDLAKECFIQCLKENKEDYTSLYSVIHCFEFMEEHREAVVFLNSYLETNPYSEIAWHQLARQYVYLNMPEEALISIDFAIYSDDQFTGAYLEKAKILENMNAYEEAIELYKTVLDLENPTAFTYLRMGKCYEKLGDIKRAQGCLQRSVHEDPLLGKGWMTLAEFHYRLGDYKKTRGYVQKAIDIDSENILCWMLAAENNIRIKSYDDAITAYLRVIELGFTDIATCCKLIDIYIIMRRYQEALSFTVERCNMFPDDLSLKMRLVAIYFKISDTEKGRFHLLEILKKVPSIKKQILQLFPFLNDNKVALGILNAY
ncbi:tetratricopeptide repeat-containing protein [Elysia marginata]|uniref:Cell division cycle protein 27 homolog n=1 Tax=Elysia marginata TaxID=1093978 RepID=A0AAV4EZZ9_9GAST|nr:tetratricopeptide repeat-containing protein [Elysia marginata]